MKLNQDPQELDNRLGSVVSTDPQEATLVVPYDISDEEQRAIVEKFPQIKDKKLSVLIDEALMGGFVVTYGSKMIDLSIRGALQSLLKKLYED